MANVDKVNGASPVMHLDGSPWNGVTQRLPFLAADGTAAFVGDFVKPGGTADADGVMSITQAAAGDTTILGVIVSFEPDPTDLSRTHRLASTLRYANVCVSPDVIYEIQEDNTATFAITMVGENADIVVAAGATTTGASGMELNTTSHVTTTAQLRIMGVVQRPDNVVGVNAKLLVLINEHLYKTTSGI